MAEYRVGSEGGARVEGVRRKEGEKMKAGKGPPDMGDDGGNPVVGEKQR